MVLLSNLVSFLWLIRGRVVWVALPMFAPIKQGSLLGYAMFTTMHRDEMKSYGPLCKTSSKKVAKFAHAMFSTKKSPEKVLDTIWILSKLATDFGTTLVSSNVSLQRPEGTNNRIICAKQETQKVTVHHNWSCLSGQLLVVTRKKNVQKIWTKTWICLKKCLERNQFYLKWLFRDGDFHYHPIR